MTTPLSEMTARGLAASSVHQAYRVLSHRLDAAAVRARADFSRIERGSDVVAIKPASR